MIEILLLLALGARQPGSPLDSPTRPRPEFRGVAVVEQVTGARAYLDAGAEDGLTVGQVLELHRGEVGIGPCTVETTAPHHATCTGVRARPGDAVRVPRHAAPEVKVVTLPPLPSGTEQERRAEQLAMAPTMLIEAKAKPVSAQPLQAPRGGYGQFSFSDVSWWSSDLGAYHADRVDATLHGAPVGPFTADVDLRGEYWSSQPATAVFRPADKARILIWQAQLNWAPEARSYSISAGRVLAWNVPGATPMDGATVSWRRGGFTGGLMGGLVPQPDTTSPTSTRATAGGFWGWEGKLGKNVLFREEGRLALVRTPELGDRVELQTGGSLNAGRWFDLFGDARFGFGGKAHAPAGLDGVRLEAAVRPLERLALTGAFDYGQLRMPQPFMPLAWAGRTRHADGGVSWDFGLLRAGLSGGASRDLDSGIDHAWAGPEVVVPRFFSPRVSLSGGYLEEVGWLKGRSTWLQAVARPWDPVRLIARASWNYQSNVGLDQNEFGLYLSGSADLTRHIGVRISLMGRAAIDVLGDGNSMPLGFSALASIYSMY